MFLLVLALCSTAGGLLLNRKYALKIRTGILFFALALFFIPLFSDLCARHGSLLMTLLDYAAFSPAATGSARIPAALIGTALLYCICALFLRRFSCPRSESPAAKKAARASWIIVLVPSILFFAYIWARDRYPLEQPEAVFYTLTMPLTGMDGGLPLEVALSVFLPALLFTFADAWLSRQAALHFYVNRESGKSHNFGAVAPLSAILVSAFFLVYIALALPLSAYITAAEIIRAGSSSPATAQPGTEIPPDGQTASASALQQEAPHEAGGEPKAAEPAPAAPAAPAAPKTDRQLDSTETARAAAEKAQKAARAQKAAQAERALGDAFYRQYYVDPRTVQLEFPAHKKNIIIIMMESMESSFSDKANGGFFDTNYIPHLTALAENSINFSATDDLGGGMKLYGTSWTIAAFLSKFNGIPFALSGSLNPVGLKHFLPGSIGLTDILAQAGYRQLFIFGSDEAFASRGTFFRDHGNVELHDFNYYKKTGDIPADYHVYWGIEDQRLYPLARMELDKLAESDTPFMFGLLTVDTHTPGGYVCPICPDNGAKTEEGRFSDVVLCADQQVSNFLDWAKTQSWYSNTVIAVMGDHQFMNRRVFPPDATVATRYWIDLFVNSTQTLSAPGADKRRKFSSFDMFPTILESMGVNIPGRALGFGRSLYSPAPTLIEELGSVEKVNAGLEHPSSIYDSWIHP